jgi:hypothetical protein
MAVREINGGQGEEQAKAQEAFGTDARGDGDGLGVDPGLPEADVRSGLARELF